MDPDHPPVRLEQLGTAGDLRRFSPSAGRNRYDVVGALARVLPRGGKVLEVAAGTGEHAVLAVEMRPDLVWQPADRDPEVLASQRAWRQHSGASNLLEPVELDLTEPWPFADRSLGGVVAINLLHIAPWSTALALLDGAARTLRDDGVLAIYGAFFADDRETAPSNVAFDRDLRQVDASYGVRRVEDVATAARERGLALTEVVEMPNNNLLLVLRLESP